jgi:hypothetical protein
MAVTEIDYELTQDDLIAFHMHALKNSPTVKRFARRTRVMYVILILVMAALTTPWSSGVALAGFVVGAGTFILGAWLFTNTLTRRAIKDQVSREIPEKGQLGRHHMRIDETGVYESTAVGETRVAWAGIDRIDRDEDAIFIYTTPHAAHMIPRRAFATPDAADSFADLAESYLRAQK